MNLGADLSYRFHPRFGVGTRVRFVAAIFHQSTGGFATDGSPSACCDDVCGSP
jgi:hypothetical protein